MIGLPTETDDDLVAIRDLTLQMRDAMVRHARGRGRIGRIVGSVNPLIPKPGTAYQWLPMEDPALTDRKSKRLRQLLADIDNVYVTSSRSGIHYQALLSLGDRRVAPAIEAAERNGGNWRAAVAETGVDADFYIFRDRSADTLLPWDIIDGGMKTTFFKSEFEKALRESGRFPPSGRKRTPGSFRSSSSSRPTIQALTAAALVLGIRLQHQLANAILRRDVCNRAEQRKAPAFAVHRALTSGERDVAAVPVLRSQIPKPISLRPSSGPSVKCSSASASFPGRVPLLVRKNLDDHGSLQRL